MGDRIIKVEYENLDKHLKDQVKEHFFNDAFLVPFEWDEHILDDLEEKYDSIINFDRNRIKYNMDIKTFNLSGNVYLEHPDIEKLLPKKYHFWDEKGWFYSINDEFVNGEMNREFEIDELAIQFFVEEEMFGYDISDDSINGLIELDINKFKPIFKKNIEIYKDYNPKVLDILKKWLELMETSENLFFQTTIEVEEDDCNFIIGKIIDEIINEIETFMEDTFFDKLDVYVDGVFDEFKNNLISAYEYYFSDEKAEVSLGEKIYEVIIDEDGNQIEIVDLDGE